MSEVVFPQCDDDGYVQGRLEPSIDQDVFLPESVEVKRPTTSSSKLHSSWQQRTAPSPLTPQSYDSHGASIATNSDFSPVLALPRELLGHIFSFLGPLDLVSVSSTCQVLSTFASSDLCWQRHVQDSIPGLQLTSPSPFNSYREFYKSHDPYWFLTKYKIWFCDCFLTGKIIICRYDPRRRCIEGYRLVAERPPSTFDPWEADDEVLIHSFDPRCRLHLDQPVLQLDTSRLESLVDSAGNWKPVKRFSAEVSMRLNNGRHDHGVFSNFFLARSVEEFPGMSLWPPPTVPARSRVRNVSQEEFVGVGHKPEKRSQISEQAFRIRRWIQMVDGAIPPGIHPSEEVYTYGTLDPKTYTPTESKPYRGIWVGDYGGHGCEFLLLHQPDDEEPFDEASVIRGEYETVEEWKTRQKEERIYRGSLEAIKLTGDPNVPRGEYTFIADDISKNGLIRTATEQRFRGARIVRSSGHIASPMYRNHKYIESQLILISTNKLAQYWVGFGHISFYHRVDIDQFLSPFTDHLHNPI